MNEVRDDCEVGDVVLAEKGSFFETVSVLLLDEGRRRREGDGVRKFVRVDEVSLRKRREKKRWGWSGWGKWAQGSNLL